MRCYDGCPDDELKALFDAQDSAKARVLRLNPRAHVTFHSPTGYTEWGYQAHEMGRPLGPMCRDYIEACNSAVAACKDDKQQQ